MTDQNELLIFYEKNKDFRDYIDKCVKTYGKDINYMLQTKTAQEYYQYLKEKMKGKDENQ